MRESEFLLHAYFDKDASVYRWNANDKIPQPDIQRKAGVAEEVIERGTAIREVETTLGMKSIVVGEPVAVTFPFAEAISLRDELRLLVISDHNTFEAEKMIDRLTTRIDIIYGRSTTKEHLAVSA